MDEVVTALLDEQTGIMPIIRGCSKPNVHYATFGHSMGAWVAFAMVQRLRREHDKLPLPIAMFASCNRAPHLVGFEHDVHSVEMHTLGLADGGGDAAFWNGMAERYGDSGMSPGIKKLMLPLLRADFQIIETWDPSTGEADRPDSMTCSSTGRRDESNALVEKMSPFGLPIVAIGAMDDRRYTPEQLSAWELHTTGAFREEWVAGGHHYFQHGDPEEVLRIVTDNLEAVLEEERAS